MKERIEIFLEQFRQPLPDYLAEMEKDARQRNIPVIRRGTGDVLRYLICTKRPGRVLELGTAIGYSALLMREYLPETSRVTTVEKVAARRAEARENFAAYDKDGRIRLLEGDALDVLPELVERGEKFDFVFMDAAKGQYLKYLPFVLQLMLPGGLLVSDNMFHGGEVLESRYAVVRRDRTIHGRMREYLKVISGHESLTTLCLPVGDGIAICTYCPGSGGDEGCGQESGR